MAIEHMIRWTILKLDEGGTLTNRPNNKGIYDGALHPRVGFISLSMFQEKEEEERVTGVENCGDATIREPEEYFLKNS